MDWSMILFAGWTDPASWLFVLQVAVGLGMVIFIHELGHFLVAKACGVKCEKFFVGFDIGGWKISRQWGETEYGIGILPLGGYVKMLGQEDNPYRTAEEMERAKVTEDDAEAAEEVEEQYNEPRELDPRSYQAKPVWQRMAIISAGVVMNIILCFVLATIAYSPGMGGVKYEPSVIGRVSPGSRAWEAGLTVGTEVLSVNGVEKPRFNKDLRREIGINNPQGGAKLVVRLPGETEPRKVTIHPKKGKDGLARIGILSSARARLAKESPLMEDSPAANASPDLLPLDRIVGVKLAGGDGEFTPIEHYYQLHEQLVRHANQRLSLRIEREQDDETTHLEVDVAPLPMKRLGLVMEMGPVENVKPDSPAAKAGIKPDDQITKIVVTGEPNKTITLDPVTLPEQLRLAAHEGDGAAKVTVTLKRGSEEVVIKDVTLDDPRFAEKPFAENAPLSAPALGVTYRALNRVAEVEKGGPADGKVAPGAVVTAFKLVQPDVDDFDKRASLRKPETTVKFGDDKQHWGFAEAYLMQLGLPDSKVELTIDGLDEAVELEPAMSPDYFLARRGFRLEMMVEQREAATFGEAIELGARETWESLTMVVTFLGRIKDLIWHAGGPITIATIAAATAELGLPDFLAFLAMLSANLAVINALPIPVLDGGHFVFLAYEGIRRKPPSEKVFLSLTYLGFAFILGLMIFVIALDIGRLTE